MENKYISESFLDNVKISPAKSAVVGGLKTGAVGAGIGALAGALTPTKYRERIKALKMQMAMSKNPEEAKKIQEELNKVRDLWKKDKLKFIGRGAAIGGGLGAAAGSRTGYNSGKFLKAVQGMGIK
jgi:hypothetical protein